MDTNFSKRFTDYKLIDAIIAETEDFKQRTFKVKGIKVIYHLLIILFLSILFVWSLIGITQADITKVGLDHLIVASGFLLSIFMLLIFISSVLLIDMYKLITKTQFQTLLFSAGLCSDSKGFIILAQDKNNIIYMDEQARTLFKNTARNNLLNTFVADIKMNEEAQNELNKALSINNKYIYKTLANQKELSFVFLPLNRPKGFFIIKIFLGE